MARRSRSTRNPGPHYMVRGAADGWFACACGCGFIGVCRHCLPGAPGWLMDVPCEVVRRQHEQAGQEVNQACEGQAL